MDTFKTIKIGALGLSLLFASCSFRNQELIDPTVKETAYLGEYAKKQGLDSVASQSKKQIESSRKLQEAREYEPAYAQAEAALLSTRLAMVLSEQNELIKTDSLAQQTLDSEKQEKRAYENILKARKAARGENP